MSWGLRIKIIKSHNIFTAQNDVCWDLALNNLAEDAIGI
jgi:hypothetical protein